VAEVGTASPCETLLAILSSSIRPRDIFRLPAKKSKSAASDAGRRSAERQKM
jgi:hypothetical protein